jgi:hypothetical protein
METNMRRRVIAESHGFNLARRDVVGLDGTHSLEVRVHRGTLWLTQEGDRRDYVIGAGESFRFDRAGRAVVEVLANAEITLHTTHPDTH